MSADNTNSANYKAQKLCKMGCGFFGSDATGDCCSKCWTDSLKSQEKQQEQEQQSRKSRPAAAAKDEPVPMEVDPIERNQNVVAPEVSKATEAPVSTPRTTPPKKKKKKKTSYKNMMSTMMTSSSSDEKKAKDNRENINKSGGGAFTKIDRI